MRADDTDKVAELSALTVKLNEYETHWPDEPKGALLSVIECNRDVTLPDIGLRRIYGDGAAERIRAGNNSERLLQ
jgi:hypothetical protein